MIVNNYKELLYYSIQSFMNIDTTILAEKPKLAPYFEQMKTKIATSLELSVDQIGIKATTTEQTGPIGIEEAIAAYAVCLLEKKA